MVKLFEGSLGMETSYASTLAFVAEDYFGSATLMMTEPYLLSCHPRGEVPKDEVAASCSDWAGEMINQVVGNMKRLIYPYGVECKASLPTVLRGKNLSLYAVDHEGTHKQWWQLKSHTLKLVYNIISNWEFDFAEPIKESSGILKPSEVLHFDKKTS
jgi:hypothetical protein